MRTFTHHRNAVGLAVGMVITAFNGETKWRITHIGPLSKGTEWDEMSEAMRRATGALGESCTAVAEYTRAVTYEEV